MKQENKFKSFEKIVSQNYCSSVVRNFKTITKLPENAFIFVTERQY